LLRFGVITPITAACIISTIHAVINVIVLTVQMISLWGHPLQTRVFSNIDINRG
jgi:hypothetical protein